MKFLIANWKMNLVDSDNWLLAFNENFDNSSINNSFEIEGYMSITTGHHLQFHVEQTH